MTNGADGEQRWRRLLRRLSPLGSWKSAALWVALGVNIVLAVLYLWSRGGYSVDVRIEVDGARYAAYVDGKAIGEGTFGDLRQGGIGFSFPGTARIPSLPGPTGIDRVRVTDLQTHETLFEDDFASDASPLWEVTGGSWHVADGAFVPEGRQATISTGARPWRNYALDVTLRNPIDLTVFVRERDANSRLSVGMQVFQTYRTTFRVTENSEVISQKNGLALQLDRTETMRSIFAIALRPYPLALLMIAGAAVLAFAARWAWLEPKIFAAGRAVASSGPSLIAVFGIWSIALLWYLLYVVGDAMPHVPDDTAYVFQSKIFASFRLTGDRPAVFESFSFFHPPMFKVVDGRWFSQYPFAHPLVLSIGQLVHAVWLVPPVAGTLCMVLIYVVGRRVHGSLAGLLAAVLLLFSPFFQMTASNFMAHNTAALMVIVCLFFLTRPLQRRHVSMFLAGVFMGLMFNMRPLSAVAFMAVVGGFLAYELWRAGPERRQVFGEQLALAAGGVSMLLAYFGYNLATTGDVLQSPYALQGTYSENTFGFGGAHSLAAGLQNQRVHLALLLLVANGWPATFGFVFALLPFVLGTRHRWDYFLLASFVAVGAAQVFYVRAPIMHGPRFWYEMMPFLVLLTARGAQLLIERSGALAGWAARAFGVPAHQPGVGVTGTAVLGLVAGLVAFSSWGWMLEKRDAWSGVRFTPQKISMLEGFNFTDDRLLEAADDLDLDNALIFVEKCPNWWCYGSVFWTNNVDLDGNVVWVERQNNDDDLDILEHYPERALYIADYDGRSVRPATRAEIEDAARTAEASTGPPPDDLLSRQRRDDQRKADLDFLRRPLEEYHERFGRYPSTENRIETLCLVDTDTFCALRNVIPQFPEDPLGASPVNGYWYASDGTQWVVIAKPESNALQQAGCPQFVLQQASERRYCVTGPSP